MVNCIAQAVAPLRADAIARAEKNARDRAEAILADLATYDWDLQKAAPYPRSMMDRKAYVAQKRKRDIYNMLTSADGSRNRISRSMNDPDYRLRDETKVNHFIEQCKEGAGLQYDAFVAKLTTKVGEGVTAATLNGNHVWGHSILLITKADGSTEKWKTQQIVNTSALGLLFNQWPSRKVK